MKYLFIGGCARSGTSLLQKMIISHSQITGGGEFDYLPRLVDLYSDMSLPEALGRQKFFYNQQQLTDYWRNFILQILGGNVDESKYTYLSEKTPQNIYVAARLLDLIPDCKFIYVYRDGRDATSSFMQVKRRFKENKQSPNYKMGIKQFALFHWNNSAKHYEDIKNNSKYNNRHIAVQYEQLVNEPEKALTPIMKFLELPIEKAQLAPELYEGGEGFNIADNIWYTKEMEKQKINKQNVGKWKQDLTFFQKFELQVLIARHLKAYNYPIAKGYLTLNSILRKIYNR